MPLRPAEKVLLETLQDLQQEIPADSRRDYEKDISQIYWSSAVTLRERRLVEYEPFPQPDITPIGETAGGYPIYRLDQNYAYRWEKDTIKFGLTVRAGFTYDGASVPRLVWTLTGFLPDGLQRAAALVHDFIYRYGGMLSHGAYQMLNDEAEWVDVDALWSRKAADRLFGRMMREASVSRKRRRLAYLAVRLFGWWSWRKSG